MYNCILLQSTSGGNVSGGISGAGVPNEATVNTYVEARFQVKHLLLPRFARPYS